MGELAEDRRRLDVEDWGDDRASARQPGRVCGGGSGSRRNQGRIRRAAGKFQRSAGGGSVGEQFDRLDGALRQCGPQLAQIRFPQTRVIHLEQFEGGNAAEMTDGPLVEPCSGEV